MQKNFDDEMFESTHITSKPYFRHLHSKFIRGQFDGYTYLNVWIYFPQHIEWLILNHDLIIDLEEFEKVPNKQIEGDFLLGKSLRDCVLNENGSTKEPFKDFKKHLQSTKYLISDKAKAKLNLYKSLIDFNRKKLEIRQEWKTNQENKLPIVAETRQFTAEIKENLVDILTRRNNKPELHRVSSCFDLLGITSINIENAIFIFNQNLYHNYSEPFIMFLLACVYYGCGEYDKNTTIPTSQKAIAENKKPVIIYNWFDFNSAIETRVDTLLSVECLNRQQTKP
jgi:hypothetical protein